MTRCIKVSLAALLLFSFPSVTHADTLSLIQAQSISTNYHTCAVQDSGTLRCWGGNSSGESNVPSDLGLVQSVDVGGDSTCAIQVSGFLRCWGRNNLGQTDLPTNLGKVSQVSVNDHTCAIVEKNLVRCWGNNASGEIAIPDNFQAIKIVTGWKYTCAISTLWHLSCWGANDSGKLNIPSSLGEVREVSLGWVETCAIKLDGELVCWGDSELSQIPAGLGKVNSVSVGWAHVCAISELGALFCWGRNTNGQITIPEDLGKVSEVSTGDRATCVIDNSNMARCWGANWYGGAVPPSDLGKLRLSLFNNPVLVGKANLNSEITSQQASGFGGVNYSYQWLRDGEVILGATQSTYLLSKRDYLRYVSVKVTGQAHGVFSQTKISSAVFVVKETEAFGDLSFSGAARVNSRVTARISNSSSKFDYTYQWFRNQSPITNESDKTYLLRPQDAGQSISIQSCMLFRGQVTGCVNKELTQNVDYGLLGPIKASIVGVPKAYRLLSASVAARVSDLEIKYQWLRDGVEIQGATSKTYLIQPSDSGSSIIVRIEVSKPGYEPQLKESIPKRVN